VGVDHKVIHLKKPVTISLDDNGTVLVLSPKKLSDQSKLLQNFLKIYLMEFYTDCLTACLMQCNSIMAKATHWFFHCSTSLWPERCLLAYWSMYNTFFMYLRTSALLYVSFDSEKCQFGGCMWWLSLHSRKISIFFLLGYFDYTVAFQILLDPYCVVTGWTQLATESNGYFIFQMIIDILGHAIH